MHFVQAIGWLGQGAYFSRSILQWAASERARRSVVPGGFWILSVLGALALLTYAALRADPVIMLGQAVNLCIYLRNLWLERRPGFSPLSHRALSVFAGAMALGLLAVMLLSLHLDHSAWIFVGWLGQFIFLTRFPLQWWRAERSAQRDLPALFWWISLSGSLLLLVYALWRHDPVIATGQAVGLLTYTRNLMLQHRARSMTAS